MPAHNRQLHYTELDDQPADIVAQSPDFEGGCVLAIVKYVMRYPRKHGLEDLRKARQFLHWLIGWLEAREQGLAYVPTDHLLDD